MARRLALVALLGLTCTGALLVSRREVAPESYFGLSPTRSTSGRFIAADRLGNSDYCAACHTQIFHEWGASAHHFSSLNNPFYRQVALATLDERGPAVFKLCAGCHDPIPLLSGRIDTLDVRDWPANAGITCVACHRIDAVHGHNGAYTMAQPSLDTIVLSSSPMLREAHSAFVRALPSLHGGQFKRALHSEPEYCRACHTLVVPRQVNGVRDLVLQDDHGSWLHGPLSGANGTSPRTTCIHCHMPLVPSEDPAARDGLARSHRFLGGNTALPLLNREAEHLSATERFLRERAPRLRVEAVNVANQAIDLRVTVANESMGHAFPGGTSESNEAWLALDVRDEAHAPVFTRGAVDPAGEITGAPDFLRSVFLDSSGHATTRGTTSTRAVAHGPASTVPPGASRTFHYRFGVPRTARFPLEARVELKWRKFSRQFTQAVFPQSPPELPITTLAAASMGIEAKRSH